MVADCLAMGSCLDGQLTTLFNYCEAPLSRGGRGHLGVVAILATYRLQPGL